MRILWHGVGPWHKTGYGVQTAIFAPRLAALGHDVALAVLGGRRGVDDKPGGGHPGAQETWRTGRWQGLKVAGHGYSEFALPPPLEIRGLFGGHDPDVIITLKDPWVLDPAAYRRQPGRTVTWIDVDCDPLGTLDRLFYEQSGALPVAASKFGKSMLRKAGLKDARYIPHAIDTAVWTPGPQAEARELLGLPAGAFIAGINAANLGPRKAWGEQLTAFARFHGKHPDSLLLIHARPDHPEGTDLRDLASAKGIEDAVKFGAHWNMDDLQMANWYRSLDVLLNCTYGEGFGVPIVEALACGVRVIGTDCSAISEKIVTSVNGWLVGCQPWWNPQHRADWHIPFIRGIEGALGMAWTQRGKRPLGDIAEYNADRVTAQCWKPLLEEIAHG